MTTNHNNTTESKIKQHLNWFGDKLLDMRNYVEEEGLISVETRELINGMDVKNNYNILYQKNKANNPSSSEVTLKLFSATGALLQAYTGPTLEYAVDRFSRGVKPVFGERSNILIQELDRGLYAEIAQDVGSTVSDIGVKIGNLFFGVDSNKIENIQRKESLISTISEDGKSSTVEVFQSQNSVVVSSEDIKKEDLQNISNSIFQNQEVGSKVKVEGSNGIFNATLLNEEMLEEANKVLKTDLDFDSNLKIDVSDDSFLLENNKDLILKDGTTASLESIANSAKSSQDALPKFLTHTINFGQDLLDIFEDIFSTDRPVFTDENGNEQEGLSNLDFVLSDFTARVLNGESADKVAINIAERQLAKKSADLVANKISAEESIKSGVAVAIAEVGLAYMRSENLDSDDYATVTTQAILAYFGVPAATSAAIVTVSEKLLEENGDLNSQEYKDLAITAVTTAAVVYASIKIASVIGMSIGGPVGAGIGYIVGAVVGYLIAEPAYNALKSKVDAIEQIYDALEDALKGDNFEDQYKEALKGFEDFAKAATIDLAKDIGRSFIKLTTGSYGINYAPGEYPNPYSYLNVTPKADGTGNKIVGVESEGVVAIAREYYHDDIYGNSGSDNLVGRSGTNTIYGYGGNDYIEGRGDIDLLFGGAGDDEIVGGDGNDQLYGSGGSDLLFGGAGNDEISGGAGSDFVQGGLGDDQILGDAGSDTLKGNAGDDTILGGTGADIIEGGDGSDAILGEAGDDLLFGGDAEDVIEGGAGEDIIYGGAGNDNIEGGDGADEIYGESGIDIIYGGSGNDLINSGSDHDLVFGGISNDVIYGDLGDDSLYGEIGNDYVIGASGDDIIDGGDGDDVLVGGIGDDVITTGAGNDTIIFRSGDGSDVIDESETIGNYGVGEVGDDVIRLTDFSSSDSSKVILTKSDNDLVINFYDDLGNSTSDQITISNQFVSLEIIKTIEFNDGYKIDLENITINEDNSISYTLEEYENIDTTIQEELALGYNDQMEIMANQENPESTYNLENYNSSSEQDQINFEKYNEVQWRSYKKKRSSFGGHYTVWYKYYEGNLYGTNGNDRVVGHWWDETIYGGNGNDELKGGDGNDTLLGGAGDDILKGGSGNDTAKGESGEDLIYGGAGNDNLDGGANNDAIYGNNGNDTIIGGSGDDYLEGNNGDDNLSDDSGNNIIIAGLGADNITTNNGNNKIEGGEDADTINANSGNNLIYGNGGHDSINAGSGNDTIYGQEGSDLINAGAGDDYISGGSGDDILNGEDGSDIIYGDIGIDNISGGLGVDYIYGGAGADIISGDSGGDVIQGGGGDDLVEGGEGSDTIYGNSGSDNIFGDSGDDVIDGGIGGDVLNGGEGNDTITGGQGNDILVDGAGSDILDGGSGSDIIILTKEKEDSTSIDTIKNFNHEEDKIILKVDYKNPISFANISENIEQDGNDAKITLDNGQTIIIENTNISNITSNNFQIGLAGGEDNEILFGTSGEDVIFGEGGNDEIFGGDGNDELWGGKGSDALYGEAGDDILRYEADGKYVETKKEIEEYGEIFYHGFYDSSWKGYMRSKAPGVAHGIINISWFYNTPYKMVKEWIHGRGIYGKPLSKVGKVTSVTNKNTTTSDVFVLDKEIISQKTLQHSSRGDVKGRAGGFIVYDWSSAYEYKKVEFTTYSNFYTKNFYNNSLFEITGYNRTYDRFDGGDGVADTILMTEGNDVLALDDPTSSGSSKQARIKDISVIHAGAGNDVINFSTSKYIYGDVIVYGGKGDDRIWLNDGDDQIFGGEGNDEIYSDVGNDNIVGGAGNDTVYAGADDDVIEGGSGSNILKGQSGNDLFIAGEGADQIYGGNDVDTISYVNSSAAVNINLSNNQISGGDAENDTISKIENIIATAFDDVLIGSNANNEFTGGAGDDTISGGKGADIYHYNFGDGIDTITESGSDVDKIKFANSISKEDLSYSLNGNNLEIQIGFSSENKIILTNQYQGSTIIEQLEFLDETITITNNFFIINEDEELNFTLNDENSRQAVAALYGLATYNDLTNEIDYTPEENFFGIDSIFVSDESGNQQQYSIFVNSVNDAPITSNIQNSEVKVEEDFEINLSDYFSDIDSDELSYEISLNNFNTLPDWINFDEETSILSFSAGRDGRLDFNVRASDSDGSYIEDEFTVRITRDIIAEIIPTAEIFQLLGTSNSDTLEAITNSADIIQAGDGDDIINYTQDEIWQEYANFTYNAWNIYSGDVFSITGKVRSYDAFDGGDGYDILNLSAADDVIFLDDTIVSNLGEVAKLSSIEEINAGDGDDIIDLTSLNFVYDDVILNGGNGDDVLWSSDGDDVINAGNGNDNIQSALGNDTINAGQGDDIIKAHDGDDIITGGAGADVITGGAGNDQFIYNNLSDSTGSNLDIILDFTQGEDQIDISSLGFNNISQGQGSAQDSSTFEYYFDVENNTIITDPNSNFAIKLIGEFELSGEDFIF